MKSFNKPLLTLILIFILTGLSACAPEVGTEAWCKQMNEKPKGDWTANEAGDYTKHCIFK
jgi:hypothetical protein